MDQEKVGKFIKEIRKKNNLTQKDLALKYGVTYQAVSKWENGKNLPDINLLYQMSKDYNVELFDMLDGNKIKKNNKKNIIIISFVVLLIISLLVIVLMNKNKSFEFKTISSTCSDFIVKGSLAYDNKKSSIYISDINYCGGTDDNYYSELTCNLYETNNDNITIISSCETKKNITLDEYLKNIEFNIDNYEKKCKMYTNNTLFLEITAVSDNNIKTYKIPLNVDNCN